MAQLPPDGEWLIQDIDGLVILFQRGGEREIVRFVASDGDGAARAQQVIAASELPPESQAFAHFWSGYFYGCARNQL